jgi:hypothetical protein
MSACEAFVAIGAVPSDPFALDIQIGWDIKSCGATFMPRSAAATR